MVYIWALVSIILFITFFYGIVYINNKEENILEDIPVIDVSRDSLEKHAMDIANNHSNIKNTNCRRRLIKNLDISYKKIIKSYEYIDGDVKNSKEINPASEWLLDNLYLIEKEYKHIKYNMPRSYYNNLPVIDRGVMKCYPRVYHIAVELVSHTDGKIDEDTIKSFVEAYQNNTVLTSGEIWALPIMLRIALIQNISKISENIVFALKEKEKADQVADRIINAYEYKKATEEIQKNWQDNIEFNIHFTERLLKVLRDNGVDAPEVYKWIDEKLELKETNTKKIINLEHQKQAAYQFSMANSINSIREVEALNWRQSFEKLSFVESILRQDPSDIYANMDFESRDYYRHKVEKLARRMKKPESFVAKKAIECAKEATEKGGEEYEKHVGYYIIDDGIKCLKDKVGFRNTSCEVIKNNIKNHRVGYYIGTIIIGTILTIGIFINLSYINDAQRQLWRYILAVIVLIVPCSEIVISILNWNITNLTTPRFVPKIEFQNGIGEENRTIVVIPTIINSVQKARELIKNMEVYYLANCDKNIFFALLSDFKDSDEKEKEEDIKIVEAALKYVERLNRKYCSDREDIFYFLSRYRKYNEKEKKWMGWERKRGKLMEFNFLIRGDKKTSYNVISGDIKQLCKAKYVITLDSDTILPRESAKKLVGAMSHVLNKPYIDNSNKKVLRGYGIMQPRINISILSANKTMFSKIFSGETGLDTYTTAVSDVYQDLFKEGIFTGKGIYNIDTFNYMLSGEIPENSILSHDLLEGSYVRTALVTDVEFIDDYPAYYNSSAKRLHRWVRGDWQLLPWFKKKHSINALSKWKMLDNLRRSLLAPSVILLTGLSFNVLPDGTDKWIVAAILSITIPLLFSVTESLSSPVRGISLSGKVNDDKIVIEQVFLLFSFLPYVAYIMVDAIIRTLYRLYISKKNLLEWQTAADVEAKSGKELKDYISSMWVGSLISIIILILAFNKSTDAGVFIFPSCAVWFLSPVIAWYVSREIKDKRFILNNSDEKILRRIGRKTWAYFEDFVDDKNNWLAPDNYQDDPKKGIAHRTSPTNMGMGITSNIVAYDLGYIGLYENIERLEKILNNIESLESYRGHLYNWYDTVTKKPLNPRYISTVDSGNLACYMWLSGETLKQYLKSSFINKNFKKGICDTLHLANEELYDSLNIENYYEQCIDDIFKSKFNLSEFKKIIQNLKDKSFDINKSSEKDKFYWNFKVGKFSSKILEELEKFLPWIDKLNEDINEDIVYKLNKLALDTPLKNIEKDIEQIIDKHDMPIDLKNLLKVTKSNINDLINRIKNLIKRVDTIVNNMDFKMLYDKKRGLFSIGYEVARDTLSKSYYDLLASEARQASFLAIAKGDVEVEHWFKLGRAMTLMGNSKGLVSWSGTMFEYLMPLLIMKSYPKTLLSQTYKAVVNGQKKYCSYRKVPWGISESAYMAFDIDKNYQYKAFGVPGIGMKRGLKNELVISPYSTVMALQVDAKSAINNIKALLNEGVEGRYGLYEAIDYTEDRIPKDKSKYIVKCFMVHHEGMSLMALDNILCQDILIKRFHNISKVKATELLLQEKVPNKVVFERKQKFEDTNIKEEKQNIIARKYNTAKTLIPEVQLLSNGNYSLMISNSGSGYGKEDDIFLYRWKKDVTTDDSGMFFYIKDVKTNKYWSATYQPCKDEGDNYEVTFSEDKVEFKRQDGDISTYTEIAVSSEDSAEVRKISLTNNGNETKFLEVTSYSEVTLTNFNSDIEHPAFSNLFIRTEFVENPECLIANRRPRAKGQKRSYSVHCIASKGTTVSTIQYETSRVNFIGRGKNLKNPNAMEADIPLTNTVGAVIDPIMSLRRRFKIEPGETCKIAYTTGIAKSRDEAIELANKYTQMGNIDRVFELAYSQSIVEMKYLGIKYPQANLYQKMASKILFLNDLYKDRQEYIKNVNKGQSALWKYGISGDLPIVLLIIKDEKDKYMVRQMLNAHEYWSIKGLRVDLVILNLQDTDYIQPLQDSVRDIIATSHARNKQNKSGGIFFSAKSIIEKEDIELLKAISRIVIESGKGLISSQIKSVNDSNKLVDEEFLAPKCKDYNYTPYKFKINKLEYFNDFGGFNLEKDEYVIILKDNKNTPAPWINVIANEKFGFIISENGSSYTWYKNSRENKITTWSNDWVQDTPSEAIYIKDEDNNDVWSITPKPIRDKGEYIIEHGFGYSNFKHEAYGIVGEATMFVPRDDNVKLCRIKLKNISDIDRNLSLTYYAQMVLGVLPQRTATHIISFLNEKDKYIYAKNPYDDKFGNASAYLKIVGGEEESFTGDRTEFIGRGKGIEEPEALNKFKLSNTVGAGMDPCLAEKCKVSIKKGEEKTLFIMLGEGESIDEVENTISKYTDIKKAEEELQNVKDYWKQMLHTIKVKTPNKAMDIMLNGWLLYQTIVCRIWARSAFYQSGGAYGFRDQLQDVMAVGYVNPKIMRDHILYSATRQFLEGDVQHWWHPVVDSGIRTRFSDDLLWLPYVTINYINRTGDYDILDEKVGYLEDEPLKEGEDERYKISRKSEKEGTLYEHCIKAIERALRFGPNNIPLMGSGDWNDGMSEVGNKGRGESVWLGWFLYTILDNFSKICEFKKDEYRKQRYNEMKDFIQENLEKNAWDGGWYRRAYFDDGTPLGSIENDECQIDSLSQTWAIISNAADKNRVKEAMNALEKYLIKQDVGMVLLLTPPFDNSKLEPGYIKGYVPGVRENGGQYTHAATWVVLALTKLKEGNKALKVYDMLNPINHTKSYYECERYKVEPYAMAADVYGREPYVGRGGWTWYTGTSGWMYTVGIEGILGLKFKGKSGFVISPVIPDHWNGFEMEYNKGKCKYIIRVSKGDKAQINLNGAPLEGEVIPFLEEGIHEVDIVLNEKKPSQVKKVCKVVK